jgi:hypothetical protein
MERLARLLSTTGQGGNPPVETGSARIATVLLVSDLEPFGHSIQRGN